MASKQVIQQALTNRRAALRRAMREYGDELLASPELAAAGAEFFTEPDPERQPIDTFVAERAFEIKALRIQALRLDVEVLEAALAAATE